MNTYNLLKGTNFPAFLLAFCALAPFGSLAQGDLLIFPKRLVFEDQATRSQSLNLTNNGKDSAIYNLSFVEIRMNEEGSFKRITEPDPGQRFASPYLRFFPRKVKLAPKESQTVKVQTIRSSQLKEGEYRSHLYFRAEPEANAPQQEEAQNGSSGIAVKLTPVYGITIPVIIRKGADDTKVRMDNLRLTQNENGEPQLHISFHRSGSMSAYGDLHVRHISASGKVTDVNSIKGIGIYYPGNVRHARFTLGPVNGISLTAGKLQVIYYKNTGGTDKEQLAEAVLPLP